MERALGIIRTYRDRAQAHGAATVILVATAAVRQAANGEAFVARLRTEPGLMPRTASGPDEARLMLLGVCWGLPAPATVRCVVDIGGGSTEMVIARGAQPVEVVSVDVGVVRLKDRWFPSDPVRAENYAAARGYVGARFEAEAWPRLRPHAPGSLVGTAGTVTTLAALDLGLGHYDGERVQGHRLGLQRVRELGAWLGAMTTEERGRLPCLEPGRADVIVPGAALVEAVITGLGASEMIVADSGLREGILLDAVGWAPPER
jgi:exopolyphosphatase/guanosine-5'-triphosphate,3'-diphosphate pyrophosphatase